MSLTVGIVGLPNVGPSTMRYGTALGISIMKGLQGTDIWH